MAFTLTCAGAREQNGSDANASAATPAGATSGAATSSAAGAGEPIDGIAVRIESDVITESQVRELAAYQKLVDGKSQPRTDVIRELIDQWIVRGEATATQYPQPLSADVDRAFQALQKQIGSADEFKKRCADDGIDEGSVRRILTEQIYLARFLDFRFRPAAQIDAAQVQKYYDQELVPKLEAEGQKVPPLSDVQPEIQEVLTQQKIDALSKQWLDDTRGGLTIDVLPQGGGPEQAPQGAGQ
ncbi:MAG: hypothetical protein KGL02_06440 [Acidobacteriota bacterium]|nr:hypothetical protein [Acidobacteriota bacterium]